MRDRRSMSAAVPRPDGETSLGNVSRRRHLVIAALSRPASPSTHNPSIMSAPHDYSDKGFSTRAIHAGQQPDPVTGAVCVPISLATTYAQSSPGVPMVRGWTKWSFGGPPTRGRARGRGRALCAAWRELGTAFPRRFLRFRCATLTRTRAERRAGTAATATARASSTRAPGTRRVPPSSRWVPSRSAPRPLRTRPARPVLTARNDRSLRSALRPAKWASTAARGRRAWRRPAH